MINWKIKDALTNAYLGLRLWWLKSFVPGRFYHNTNPIVKEGWTLTFHDEFDEGEVDRDKWTTQAYYGRRYHTGQITEHGRAPKEYLADDAFEFTDTTMKQLCKDEPITVHHVDWDGKDWGEWTINHQIGQIDSSPSFEQKYGYFEIRSKVTDQPGSWPAFWLASRHLWPPEIDVYETYTGRRSGFSSNVHWRTVPGSRDNELNRDKAVRHRVPDVSDRFHTYAVEWDETGFKFYYDNLLIRVFSDPEAIRYFEHPMHIIINNGVDHPENGADDAEYPTVHEVDYVRAYKRSVT